MQCFIYLNICVFIFYFDILSSNFVLLDLIFDPNYLVFINYSLIQIFENLTVGTYIIDIIEIQKLYLSISLWLK